MTHGLFLNYYHNEDISLKVRGLFPALQATIVSMVKETDNNYTVQPLGTSETFRVPKKTFYFTKDNIPQSMQDELCQEINALEERISSEFRLPWTSAPLAPGSKALYVPKKPEHLNDKIRGCLLNRPYEVIVGARRGQNQTLSLLVSGTTYSFSVPHESLHDFDENLYRTMRAAITEYEQDLANRINVIIGNAESAPETAHVDEPVEESSDFRVDLALTRRAPVAAPSMAEELHPTSMISYLIDELAELKAELKAEREAHTRSRIELTVLRDRVRNCEAPVQL